jgi:nucleotide-binding universal stress UspA family protein
VDKLLRDTREAHKTELSKLLEPFGLPVHVEPHPRTQPRAAERKNEPRGLDKTRIHLLKGQPADVVTNLVRKERIEVIVMGTTCRTGVGGFLIGSTAEAVLSQVNCSVLTVKPSGFVTPVALD